MRKNYTLLNLTDNAQKRGKIIQKYKKTKDIEKKCEKIWEDNV